MFKTYVKRTVVIVYKNNDSIKFCNQ